MDSRSAHSLGLDISGVGDYLYSGFEQKPDAISLNVLPKENFALVVLLAPSNGLFWSLLLILQNDH